MLQVTLDFRWRHICIVYANCIIDTHAITCTLKKCPIIYHNSKGYSAAMVVYVCYNMIDTSVTTTNGSIHLLVDY